MTGPTHHDIPLDLGQPRPAVDPTPVARQAARQPARGRVTRWALIQRVRREIARGTYETQEKWEAVVSRLLNLGVI